MTSLRVSFQKHNNHFICVLTRNFNPLNPTGRYSGLFYPCIYPKGRYSGLAFYPHNPAGLYSGQMAKMSCDDIFCVERIQWLLYCFVSIHLYRASCSAHQSEALPVQKTRSEENERTKEALGSPVSKVDRVEGRSWLC